MSFGRLIAGVCVFTFVVLAVFWIVLINADIFRYQARLIFAVTEGDLAAVSSLRMRFEHWDAVWVQFLDDSASYKWAIGLGSRPEFRVADNDYYYMIWHYGISGLVANAILYCSMMIAFWRATSIRLRAFGIATLAALVVAGWQVETLSGWFYPMLMFYVLGLVIGTTGPALVALKLRPEMSAKGASA